MLQTISHVTMKIVLLAPGFFFSRFESLEKTASKILASGKYPILDVRVSMCSSGHVMGSKCYVDFPWHNFLVIFKHV